MRQTKLFTKTRKDAPADETSKNAELLIRSGFVHKEMAGVYSYLPLGLRVLNNIEKIIREEMNAIDAQEVIFTALQKKEVWEKVGRWDDNLVDVWFKTKLKDGAELGLGFTHDEQAVIHKFLQGLASVHLSNPNEVSQRTSRQERRHAWQRICHEGFVLVQHDRRRTR